MTARSPSPLRYPGGKASLYPLLVDVLNANNLKDGHYAEPFCGGAGLALRLLYAGHVRHIHINDYDRAIWAFWFCVLNHTAQLVQRIENTPVTLDEWDRQRAIYLDPHNQGLVDTGFAALFLNRTNRSGILDAGVIGGMAQDGNYALDCRFNRGELIRRIERAAQYRDQIHLYGVGASDFIVQHTFNIPQTAPALFFVDPPYVSQGRRLYRQPFDQAEHILLAAELQKLKRQWLLTYDDTTQVRQWYCNRRQYANPARYSLQHKRVTAERMIVSDNLQWPPPRYRENSTQIRY